MKTFTASLAVLSALIAFAAGTPRHAHADETAPAASSEDARRTLLLRVQYVRSDYRGAVPEAGRVASDGELAENLAFAREAAESYRRVKPGGAEQAALDRLAASVAAKASPDDVEAQASALVAPLRRELELAPAPLFFPDLALGRAAFAKRCASCHGEAGLGDGPEATKFHPPPRSLADPAWADGQSPLQVFNTITVGIAGTAMAPFAQVEDASTRWALAFAVLTLRPPAPMPVAKAAPAGESLHANATSAAAGSPAHSPAAATATPRPWIGVTELSSSSNRELTAMLVRSGVPAADAAAFADAARRVEPPPLTIAAAMARLRSAAGEAATLAAKGRRAEAGDTLDAAYFDAVEPVEPELVAKAPPHLEALETAVSTLREAIRSGNDVAGAAAALDAELDALALDLRGA